MELLLKAEAYIFNLFKDKLSSEYIYHDYLHVKYAGLNLWCKRTET